jgi:hypothetical protein
VTRQVKKTASLLGEVKKGTMWDTVLRDLTLCRPDYSDVRTTLTPPYCHIRNALKLYASLHGVIPQTNGFFTTSTVKISNLTVVQLHLYCQHHTKQADGGTAPLILKLHTKWTCGQFRNPAALPPEKVLPVRPEQDAAWAPQPVLTLVDKTL